jgi:hypothetical protein
LTNVLDHTQITDKSKSITESSIIAQKKKRQLVVLPSLGVRNEKGSKAATRVCIEAKKITNSPRMCTVADK